MKWQEEYPTVGSVMKANVSTLCAWDKYLPAPNSDVQRTVHRRIKKRLHEFINKADPAIGDKMGKLNKKFTSIFGVHPYDI